MATCYAQTSQDSSPRPSADSKRNCHANPASSASMPPPSSIPVPVCSRRQTACLITNHAHGLSLCIMPSVCSHRSVRCVPCTQSWPAGR